MLFTVLKWLLVAIVALAILSIIAGQLGMLSGKAPADLGVTDGKLKRPSKTNNSVSSQAKLWPSAASSKADIAPIAVPPGSTAAATMAALQEALQATPGARIVDSKPDYLRAECTTRLMKYVDDVEFWHDPAANVIQVRSASRLGREDFEANRKRVETLRAQALSR
jgi:uncharacterized protein (DUF1499 family)